MLKHRRSQPIVRRTNIVGGGGGADNVKPSTSKGRVVIISTLIVLTMVSLALRKNPTSQSQVQKNNGIAAVQKDANKFLQQQQAAASDDAGSLGNHEIVWTIKPSKDHDYNVQGDVAKIKPASLCACAKCGSTAFWVELFAIVQGKSFQSMNYTGPPWIHTLSNKRLWTNIQAEHKTDWLDFEDHDSFALIRDPKERIISAWKDKVSCEHADVRKMRYLTGLLKLAGSSGNNITARVSKDGGFPCLDLSEYLELLSQIHALGKEGMMDIHFLPQNLGCFKDAPPSNWTYVTTVSDPNARCSLESVVLKSANMSKTGNECLMLKSHGTGMKQSLKPTRADEANLDAITRKEYEMLGKYLPAKQVVSNL